MTLSVLTAVSHRWEAPLASSLEQASGARVIRRCADLADLLSAGVSGLAEAAIVSADLRGLDRSALAELDEHQVRILGVYPPGDEAAELHLRQLGLQHVIAVDAAPAELDAVLDVVASAPMSAGDAAEEPAGGPGQGGRATSGADESPRRLVAVWGPAGAPGRTTVAVNLAAELAALGRTTTLVDADTYGASVAQTLSLLDEAPGVAAACRAADHGSLDLPALARLAPQVTSRLRVLTGLPRADRWPELREHAFEQVLTLCRQLSELTVVDTGFCLEEDEELSYDTAAPRRNATTIRALREADTVLAVGSADPVGLQRLVRGLADLRGLVPQPPTVVVTRLRAAAVGGNPHQRVHEALERFAGVHEPVLIPDDRASLDAAMLAGRSLAESAASSAVRQAFVDLAAAVLGVPAPTRRRRRHV